MLSGDNGVDVITALAKRFPDIGFDDQLHCLPIVSQS